MLNNFLLYLAESTACLGVFSLAYRLFFSRLTHFQWNRSYLVGTVWLSILIPVIAQPTTWSDLWLMFHAAIPGTAYTSSPGAAWVLLLNNTSLSQPKAAIPFSYELLAYWLFAIYSLGFLYKAYCFWRNMRSVHQLIKANAPLRQGPYQLVYTQGDLPAFSFLHYIFLSPGYRQLNSAEAVLVLQHEQVHADQRHTWDLLLLEVAGILFWFNPLLRYLKKALREVHEYLADAAVVREGADRRDYAKLLVRLTAPEMNGPLLNGFSGKQVTQRIIMLTQTPSTSMQKLKFVLALPLIVLTLVFSAFIKQQTDTLNASGLGVNQAGSAANTGQNPALQGSSARIGKITWRGNTVFSTQTLHEVFGLKEGAAFNEKEMDKDLNYNPGGASITSLYMDKGYLFFNVDVKKTKVGENTVNLDFTVYEGVPVKVRAIIVKGNSHVATADILKKIPISSGELFNRSKLIQAQQAIAAMGYFDPEKIQIIPLPDAKAKTGQVEGSTDLEFTLVEKAGKTGKTTGMNGDPSSNDKARPYSEKTVPPWYTLLFGKSQKDNC